MAFHATRTLRTAILATLVLLGTGCTDLELGLNDLFAEPGATSDSEGAGTEQTPPDDTDVTASDEEPNGGGETAADTGNDSDDADGSGSDQQDEGASDDAVPDAGIATDAGATSTGDGNVGAGETGSGAEGCQTDGTRVDSTGDVNGSGRYLLSGGDYGSLSIPSGATVKPYDCAKVTINGTVRLGDGATLAGVVVSSDASWVLKIGGKNITVRNNTIRGGSIEAVRIHDNARNVKLVGNDIDGGRNNHVVKVKSESSGANPDAIVIRNNRFSKTHYGGSSEDLLQLEGHNYVEITENTFANNPRGEDGVDVKQGTQGMLVERNRFEGGNINAECLLVQGSTADNVVQDNVFEDCKGVSLGAHPEAQQSPWWRFEDNQLRGSMLRIRRSVNAEIVGVDMVGGTLKLGLTSRDDTPRNLKIRDSRFSDVQIDNNLEYSYECANNVMVNTLLNGLRCSGTSTAG